MAEAAFRRMIATLIRQSRPQTFRCGKPPRYPQRAIATAAAVHTEVTKTQNRPEWRSHSLAQVLSESSLPSRTRLQKLRTESEPRQFSSFLTDNYSREHSYLRISLTERCNLRCLYCMPEEGIQLSPPDHILTTPEIVYLSTLFVDQGVNKIRLTGGEPTVRKDILDLMHQIGRLRRNGLRELCLTTNGISLHRKLDSMVESGLTGVNLSLDTLDPFQFTIMTRRNGHEAVMKSINRILEMNRFGAGIKLKINCVIMRGLNDKEIIPFVELGREKDLEVRFIEYMPFDGNKWSQKKMFSFDEMLALIKEKYPDVQKVQDHVNDTSKTYKVPGFVGRIGFITSMTHNFCGTCNRLRITSDGNLKVCLFGNSEVSLRDILRESNDGKPIDSEAMEALKQIEADRRQAISGSTGVLGMSDREAKLLDVIGMAVKRKKEKHAGMGELENMKNRPMILIDEPLQLQPKYTAYQIQPSLPFSTSTLSAHSNSAFSTMMPVHLLPHHGQSSVFQQQRYRSTFLLRRTYITKKSMIRGVMTVPTFRRIEYDPLNSVKSRETLETILRVKKSIAKTANQLKLRKRFSTTVRLNQNHSLTHLTLSGAAHMVDVSHKKETHRSATAIAHVLFSHPITHEALTKATIMKGDALAVARIAGIQAAKKTSDIIPLTHPGLGITGVEIDIEILPTTTEPIESTVESRDDEEPPANSSHLESTRTESFGISLPNIETDHGGVRITATVQCWGKTGVEMEALTAVNAAALTIYDMLKALDKAMVITGSRVIEKRGGKSGSWRWNDAENTIQKFTSEPVGTGEPKDSATMSQAPRLRTLKPNEKWPIRFVPTSLRDDTTVHPPQTSTLNAFSQSPTLSTLADPDLSPQPDLDRTQPDESNAQAVFEAEWDTLSKSFDQFQPPSSQETFHDESAHTNDHTHTDRRTLEDDPHNHPHEPAGIRHMLSGGKFAQCDAEGFRKARAKRYEEWKKSR